jgi:hypothetical protein
MGDPATALAGASLAVNAAGTATAVIGADQQGRAEQKAMQFNAAIQERDAGIAVDQARSDAQAQFRQGRMVMGSIRAAYGSSGLTMEGSPEDVLEMSATNIELDRLNILYRGDLKALGYRTNATLDLMAGNTARRQAEYAQGVETLTGVGRAIDVLARRTPTGVFKPGGGSATARTPEAPNPRMEIG